MSVTVRVCPYCGSKESFEYPSNKGMMFLCYDCQRNAPVSSLPNKQAAVTVSSVTFNTLLSLCTPLSKLKEDHPCVQYVLGRKIPKNHFNLLYYTEKFQEIAKTVNKKSDSSPRLVIPFFNKSGKMFALQGRALSQSDRRYVTLVFDDKEDLVFGQERVNMNESFTIVEGPIDSLFLKNCVSMAGIARVDDKYLPTATICLDNEPRNKNTVNMISKYLDRGFKVVIWSDKNPHKDINEMVLGGIDVQAEIEKSVFKGIEGKMKLNFWKRV